MFYPSLSHAFFDTSQVGTPVTSSENGNYAD